MRLLRWGLTALIMAVALPPSQVEAQWDCYSCEDVFDGGVVSHWDWTFAYAFYGYIVERTPPHYINPTPGSCAAHHGLQQVCSWGASLELREQVTERAEALPGMDLLEYLEFQSAMVGHEEFVEFGPDGVTVYTCGGALHLGLPAALTLLE